MVDMDTFLTALYVMADDFCKGLPQHRRTPGPRASLTESEVITLVIFSQWDKRNSVLMVYNAGPDLTKGDCPRHGKSTSNSGSLNPANPGRLFRPSAHSRCRTHGGPTTAGDDAGSRTDRDSNSAANGDANRRTIPTTG